jgi:hypothetical protein
MQAEGRTVLDAVDGLLDITDPAERVRRASALIDDLSAASGKASSIRHEALIEMQAAGLTQTEIAGATGMSRARISQVLKSTAPAGQGLLAPDAGPLTICVIARREAERGHAAVTGTTLTAIGKLTDLAASYDIRVRVEQVPAPGVIDLNRPNLAVLIGPRSSPLVAQAISADPVIKWREDGHADWYFTDTKTGTEYHSQFDRSWDPANGKPSVCYAHIGRVRRPDGEGSWLCLAGEHAPGVAGATEILCRDTAELWEQARRSQWSAVARVTTADSGAIKDAAIVAGPYVHGRR